MLTQTEFHQSLINQSISENKMARVYFKHNKPPLFGRFVRLEGDKEFESKGFARFLSRAKDFDFDTLSIREKLDRTRLHLVSEIKHINLFVCETMI